MSARSSFNPCFSGFTSTTNPDQQSGRADLEFQSLFFWIHFYNNEHSVVEPSQTRFQSLFFLDSLLQLRVEDRLTAHWQVSILVFLDSLLQPGCRLSPPRSSQSFNPCFSGFTSTTSTTAPRPPASALFQSLFFLDSLLQPSIPSGSSASEISLKFQSLFFWIHFYNARVGTLDLGW